jgi:hypothetical protein
MLRGLNWSPNRLLEGDEEAYFGPLVRTLKTGSTFGELSLLQKTSKRTASVLVPSFVNAELEEDGRRRRDESSNDETNEVHSLKCVKRIRCPLSL